VLSLSARAPAGRPRAYAITLEKQTPNRGIVVFAQLSKKIEGVRDGVQAVLPITNVRRKREGLIGQRGLVHIGPPHRDGLDRVGTLALAVTPRNRRPARARQPAAVAEAETDLLAGDDRPLLPRTRQDVARHRIEVPVLVGRMLQHAAGLAGDPTPVDLVGVGMVTIDVDRDLLRGGQLSDPTT
jgi:hypothetical protein